eukprot:TRINITY_DN17699_c0_g1_i1.p3 TRINITY_DN17699_c0_g1~~TRINITY_DN17699_c0_g1_i1.p3  ORF type:complete len:217 (+),score=54.28 TRINITY_DN17699_c0_g1_i1:63-653(+)
MCIRDRQSTWGDKKSIFDKMNKGLELRNKLDQEQEKNDKQIKHSLEQKAKLYEQLMKNGAQIKDNKFLVEFDLKGLDDMTEEDINQFQAYKESFYKEMQNKAEKRESNIEQKKHVELNKEIDKMERERLAWEKEANREIESDMNMEFDPNRKLVLQSYDKVLTKEEKEHLPEIIQESKDVKSKVCLLYTSPSPRDS